MQTIASLWRRRSRSGSRTLPAANERKRLALGSKGPKRSICQGVKRDQLKLAKEPLSSDGSVPRLPKCRCVDDIWAGLITNRDGSYLPLPLCGSRDVHESPFAVMTSPPQRETWPARTALRAPGGADLTYVHWRPAPAMPSTRLPTPQAATQRRLYDRPNGSSFCASPSCSSLSVE